MTSALCVDTEGPGSKAYCQELADLCYQGGDTLAQLTLQPHTEAQAGRAKSRTWCHHHVPADCCDSSPS